MCIYRVISNKNNRISIRCDAAVAKKDAPEASGEKFEYQAEGSQLLDLIVNSVYSNKEVFLQELVSNASDAFDKFRFLSVTDPKFLGDAGELEIRIKPYANNGTITIIDTALWDCKIFEGFQGKQVIGADNALIGQFGVGFYFAFLVAQKVVVTTRSPKSYKQYVWKVEVEADIISWPWTKITLYLKEDDKYEFSDPTRSQGLVKNYSQCVASIFCLCIS
ncbi:unnamed protein product [Linum trigynum]|uniref:Heat shock protein 90 n=1 Tax=Linum trigynum TaxID=586398 RepID=A0AAV2CTW9_9ROSI